MLQRLCIFMLLLEFSIAQLDGIQNGINNNNGFNNFNNNLPNWLNSNGNINNNGLNGLNWLNGNGIGNMGPNGLDSNWFNSNAFDNWSNRLNSIQNWMTSGINGDWASNMWRGRWNGNSGNGVRGGRSMYG